MGYSYELWTTRLLAAHGRKHGPPAGHPGLEQLSRGTVSKILTQNAVRPHKVRYDLERRDPEFERKMEQVLYVYKGHFYKFCDRLRVLRRRVPHFAFHF